MSANGFGRNGSTLEVVRLADGTDRGAQVPPATDGRPSAQAALVGGMNGNPWPAAPPNLPVHNV